MPQQIPLPIPYCGLPPEPSELLSRWNWDFPLLAGLIIVLLGYLIAARTKPGRATFFAGWLLASALFTSPLCALSVSLFSARIAQHLLLTTCAAPLLALGVRPLLRNHAKHAVIASGIFTLVMWFWHAPGPYAATFSYTGLYWVMHITLTIAAVWLWLTLYSASAGGATAAALLCMLQMSILGALLTFAPQALYAQHELTTAIWGLTPAQDQQLGGLLMWVPGAAPFLIAALIKARNVIVGPLPYQPYAV